MRFIASLDTQIYGIAYLQGQEVDTEGWSRKQMLQFLNNGIISPADFDIASLGELGLDMFGDVNYGPNGADGLDVRHVLRWNGTAWAPWAMDQLKLADLAQVDDFLEVGQLPDAFLVFDVDSQVWRSQQVSIGRMSDVLGLEGVDVGDALVWNGSAFVPGAPASLATPQTYTHTQSAADIVWTIQHDLGFRPNVSVVDSLERMVWADVETVSLNQLKINFTSPSTGKAYLS